MRKWQTFYAIARIDDWQSSLRRRRFWVMTAEEHQVIGSVLMWSGVALAVGLTVYAVLRRVWPEAGWNRTGNVSTQGLEIYDLVGLGGVFAFVATGWKAAEDRLGKAMPELTASAITINAVSLLLFATVVPAVLFWRMNMTEFFGLRRPRVWFQLLWIIPTFLLVVIAGGVVIFYAGWPEWVRDFGGAPQQLTQVLLETDDIRVIVAMGIAAVLVAPVAEELIFRGYLYPVVKRFSEYGFAMLATGMLFGVIHFNLHALPNLIIIGIVLAYVYEMTGSLWVPITCHAAFNAIQFSVMLWMKTQPAAG